MGATLSGLSIVSFLLPVATSLGMRSVARALSRDNAVFAEGGTYQVAQTMGWCSGEWAGC